MYDIRKNLIVFCTGAGSVYVLWIIGHFAATHLYVNLCAPPTVVGFFKTAVSVPAPHCKLLRTLISHFGDGIGTIWTSVTAFVLSSITNNNFFL
jgi:hypothetical protein